MKDILNARIKHREMFRPFAPSILAEATGEYFEKSYPSPVHDAGLFRAARKTRRDSRAHARGRHGAPPDRHAARRTRATGG